MDFMEKVTKISKIVGKTATDTYNTVADKSGKMIEEAKLKISTSEKEGEISKIYEGLGKTVYESYKSGEDVGKVFTKECKKVDKLYEEIEEMATKILYNKGLRLCQECGSTISLESAYCENCGQKQKNVKIKKEKEQEAPKKEESKEKICSQCGLVCSPKAKFCSKCGYKFEK